MFGVYVFGQFWSLRKEKPSDTDKYADMIHILQQEFTFWFPFTKCEATFRFFSLPVDVIVEHVSDEFQF